VTELGYIGHVLHNLVACYWKVNRTRTKQYNDKIPTISCLLQNLSCKRRRQRI